MNGWGYNGRWGEDDAHCNCAYQIKGTWSYCERFQLHTHYLVGGLVWELSHPSNESESQRLLFQVLELDNEMQ